MPADIAESADQELLQVVFELKKGYGSKQFFRALSFQFFFT